MEKNMFWFVIAWLWVRVTLFRFLVLAYVRTGLPGADWLAVNTPLLWCLRRLFLDQGDYASAARCANRLREAGEL